MKQIKTIRNASPIGFDLEVNDAIQEGWTLTRRYCNHGDFIAELETEVITEAEKGCGNCKHSEKSNLQEPCLSCSDEADKWEPAT